MQYYRTCVLCDTKIRSSHRLCTIHYAEYKDQIDEPWFQTLADAQSRQDDIDRHEGYTLPYNSSTDIYGQYKSPELLVKRNVGRPATDWRVVNTVLELYDESVELIELGQANKPKSLRKLADEVGNRIDHCTVRNIIKTYRPQIKE